MHPTLRALPAPVLLMLSASLLACGSEPEGGQARAGADRPLDWEPVELFSVGGFVAPDWATFGEIGSVGFDGEGNLYVFDDQVAEITVVSPEGELVRKFGRRGDGPGEIGRPLAMTVFPDGRVAISDLGKRGLVLFDSRGEWLGNVVLDMATEGLPGPDMMAHPEGWVVSGQPLRIFTGEGGDGLVGPEERDTRPVFVYPTREGSAAFELVGAWDPPEPPQDDGPTMEAGSDGNRVSFRMAPLQAFEPGLHLAVLADGRTAVVDSTAYRIRVVDLSGALADEWGRPLSPIPVTDRIRGLERDRRLAELGGDGPGRIRIVGGGGGISFDQAQVQQAMRDRIEGMTFYPEIPVVVGLAADRDGRLWVERSGALPGDEGPVDLLDDDGTYLGSLPPGMLGIPDAFGPGGRVAVLETDDLDVVTIRVLQLPPRRE